MTGSLQVKNDKYTLGLTALRVSINPSITSHAASPSLPDTALKKSLSPETVTAKDGADIGDATGTDVRE